MNTETNNIFMLIIPIIITLFVISFYIWALFDVNKRTGKGKTGWIILVALWPVVGAIIYIAIGRKRLT